MPAHSRPPRILPCQHPMPPLPCPTIRPCCGSTARSPPSRSTGRPPSTRSIFRSPKSSNSSALRSRPRDDIRVLVIQGEGRAFCAGGDLQTIGPRPPPTPSRLWSANCCSTITPSSRRLRQMPKIVLASVHGSAAGAGLSLAFVADLCIAAEDARFTPAYAKLGVSPDGGGPSAWSPASARAGPCRSISPKTAFRRRRPMTGAWSSRSCPRPN